MSDSQQQLIIARNWQQVSADVADACQACNRAPSEVSIVGVSKYVGPEQALDLIRAGCELLGENRPQQLWEKCAWLAGQPDAPLVRWHMIGHLQRNKVARTLPLIDCLESLDSLSLAGSVSSAASKLGLTVDVLIDVNVTSDEAKTGLPADSLVGFVEQAFKLPGIRVRGLMGMSSLHGDSASARREFATLRTLRDELVERYSSSDGEFSLPHLSMGMSGDFREAITEGATLVRIGSRLWAGLPGR